MSPRVAGWVVVCKAHNNGVGPFPTKEEAEQVMERDPDPEGSSCDSAVMPIFEYQTGQAGPQMPFSLN